MSGWVGALYPGQEEQLDRALRSRISQVEAERAAGRAKALAVPSRVRMLAAIRAAEEIAVTDLCRIAEVEQTVASHHLAGLREIGLVESRRWGRTTKYSLTREGRRLLASLAPEAEPR